MAFITTVTCTKCSKTWQGVDKFNTQLCSECVRKESDIKYKEYLQELDCLTLEERVRKIEQWIYDYKPSKTEITYY